MYKVLVVDDEIYAVKGLISGVNWEKLGVTDVFEAFHSLQAKELLLAHDMDVMICDIEMPEGNGLELLEWVRENKPGVETIFFTCHAEFSFIKKAIQLGSYDYLLKPVVYAEIEHVLQGALLRVDSKREMNEATEGFQKYYQLWQSQKPIRIERFWQDLLRQRILPNQDVIRNALESHSFEAVQSVQLILISLEEWSKAFNSRDEEIMEFALQKAAEELILEKLSGSIFKDHHGNTMCILYLGNEMVETAEIKTLCEHYISSCNQYFYSKISCYVGEKIPVTDIMKSYHGLLNMEYRNVTQSNRVIFTQDQLKEDRGVILDSFNEWAEWLERGDVDQLYRNLELVFQEMNEEQVTVETLITFYHSFLQVVYYVLHRKGVSVKMLHDADKFPLPNHVTDSLYQLKNWIKQVIPIVVQLLFFKSPTNPIIQKLKLHIKENLYQEMTREMLASLVYLNPAYLSRLFRKETGLSLSDYILQERMAKAADMLLCTDKTISEIADSLGYDNFSYFARLFKKIHGMTPQYYRKSLHA
ncbi:helix-turn-helix domain-containing protein [Paenibacillus psychroresistens]|nr:helix-turn-helix domain-containing protein [Paenibacillus psychroresistens]